MVRRDGWSSPARAERPGGNRIRLTGRLVHVHFSLPGRGWRAEWCGIVRALTFAICRWAAPPVRDLPVGGAGSRASCRAPDGHVTPAPKFSGAFFLKHEDGKRPGLFAVACFKKNANVIRCDACDSTVGAHARLCGVGQVYAPASGPPSPQKPCAGDRGLRRRSWIPADRGLRRRSWFPPRTPTAPTPPDSPDPRHRPRTPQPVRRRAA